MHVTNRSDRSAATALVHFLIRPFAPYLTKTRKVYDAASPRLNPPKSAYKRCNIQERKIQEIWVYDITPKAELQHGGNKRTKRIYYFAGGSWQSPPTGSHFKLLSILIQRLSAPTVITLVSCPLAPNSPAHDTFPKLVSLYRYLSEHPGFREEDVCFAGDSSGGNIALALTMYCLTEPSCSAAQAPQSLFLISPTVTLLHEDPEIKKVERHDPIESLELVRGTANAWAGDWSKSDPRLSPLLGAVKVLAEYKVRVSGIIAGYDVLSCEARTFVERCQEAKVDGRFLIWDRQMHVFPLTAAYHLPEAKEAVEWMVDVLEEERRNVDESHDENMQKVWSLSRGKNAPGGRHGHRIFGRNERKIETTSNGYDHEEDGEDEQLGRATDVMANDADKFQRERIFKATKTAPKGHAKMHLT